MAKKGKPFTAKLAEALCDPRVIAAGLALAATMSQAGKSYSGKFLVRLPPAVHKKLALKAMARGESLNQFVAAALARA